MHCGLDQPERKESQTSDDSGRRRIAPLPEILINQIAAGEVVERPASVIKELVENSLDAGSRRIEVSLTDGGITEIRIVDDGCGMTPEDLALAPQRHTTSKVRAAVDLEAIATFGFRGEALSSIASVAEMEIRTRTAEETRGSRIEVHYGVPQGEIRPVAAPRGTAITVRRLFERVPARRKFLRAPGTELAHCARTLKELALGCPGVSVSLRHGERALADFVATTREGRVREVLKAEWTPLVVRDQQDEVSLEAYLSPPEAAAEKGERRELYLYINGRGVRNRSLTAAVRNAYLEAVNAEPSGVLYLDLRLDWVDVNVHPQKLEVRCLRQDALYPWILTSVRRALAEGRTAAPASAVPREAEAIPAPPVAGNVRVIGESRGYLLFEDAEGVGFVELSSLAEEIRREELRREMARRPLPSPRFLRVPDAETLGQKLAPLGFELEPFGDGDVALKAIPAGMEETAAEAFVTTACQLPTDADPDRLLARLTARRLTLAEAAAWIGRNPRFETPIFRLSFSQLAKHFAKDSERTPPP